MSSSSSSSGEQKSPNRVALEAITAYIQGRATSQQRKVQIGDKTIEYSSLSELLQWKRYFEEEVRKEEHKCANLRHEKIFYLGRV
jgi:hypothetical protein